MFELGTEAESRAARLHREAIVVDCCAMMHVVERPHLERLVEGGVDATVITLAFDEDLLGALHNIDRAYRLIGENDDLATFCTTVAEIRAAKRAGKVAVVFGFQDSKPIGDDLALLRLVHRLGIRVVQLTYTGANLAGDGCGELRNGGLTYFGLDLVAELNNLRVLIDVSHSSDSVVFDAIRASQQPIAITHANVRVFRNTFRNKSDEQIRALAAQRGVMGITSHPRFVTGRDDPSIADVLDNVDHVVKLSGAAHVGIGLDLVEGYKERKTIPEVLRLWRTRRPDVFGSVEDFFTMPYAAGIEDVTKLPNLTRGLDARGYSDDDIHGILGGNWLDLFERVWGA
ncbi:MAG: membrane dipeptidase [Chloroflexi bacterium]|nr:membrane dipeptidase [Chloroflexota bacterium]